MKRGTDAVLRQHSKGYDVATREEDPARLFEWLRRAYGQWGWTQKQLVEACGLRSANTLRGYQQGAKPQSSTLASIAAGVGVPVEGLEAVMRGEKVPIPASPPHLNGSSRRSRTVEEEVERLGEQVESLMALMLEHLRGHGEAP